MAKKRSNGKKQTLNVFKVSEGRAQKAKTNKSNINFKKFKIKTNEEIDKLNESLNDLQKDVRTAKLKKTPVNNPRLNTTNQSNVSIDETIDKMSKL